MRTALALLTLAVVCGGCATAPPPGVIAPTAAPSAAIVVAPGTVDSIVYVGVDLNSFAGSYVGSYYNGLLKVRQYNLMANAKDVDAWTSGFRDAGRQALRAAGYPVEVPSQIFGRWQDYGGEHLLLAGKATSLRYDEYGKTAGGYHQLGVQVDWELFDTRSKRVVYTKTTAAVATDRQGGSLGTPIFGSIFSQLLGDSAFARAARRRSAVQPTAQLAAADSLSGFRWPRPIPPESEVLTIGPTDRNPSTARTAVARALAAVVRLDGDVASGSAVLLTRDGLAVTNYHVITGQHVLRARIGDGSRLPVRVVRSDSATDVALVQVGCAPTCNTLAWSTTLPAAGAEVYAVGNPLDPALSQTVTKGIVSGIRRSGPVTLIQTDASVNHGNSGGALVSATTGVLFGIVSSKLTGAGIEGIGFAIAIEDALRVLGIRPE